MKASELRQRSDEELNQELLELRREQFNLRMQKAVGQFARSDRFVAVRQEIARIKTIMNERKTLRDA